MASTLIWLNAGIFVIYGLAFIVAPKAVAIFFTGGSPSTPAAMTDFRATYGGMTVVVGLLLAAELGVAAWAFALLRNRDGVKS
jgi:hypothetical protein